MELAPRLDVTCIAANLAQIVAPVARDGGAQLNVGTPNIAGSVYMSIPSKEANVVQNRAARIEKDRNSRTSGLHEKVVLHWFQARADKDTRLCSKRGQAMNPILLAFSDCAHWLAGEASLMACHSGGDIGGGFCIASRANSLASSGESESSA